MRTPDKYKRQDPAYRLYTADFLVRTQSMTDEQVGKYIRLLCYQHQNGHLTKEDLLSFCKGEDNLVFSKFVKDEKGYYFNEEMENEVLRRAIVSESKSQNVNKRWEKEKDKKQILEKKDPVEQLRGKINTHIPEYDDQ